MTNNLQQITYNGERNCKRVVCYLSLVFGKRDGQSLIEILIALAIGSLLIGAASVALVFVLRSGAVSQGLRAATSFSEDYINKARTMSESSWQNIFGLEKGSSTSYAAYDDGVGIYFIPGREGVIDNDVENGLAFRLKFDEDPSFSSGVAIDFSSNGNHGNFIGNPERSTSSCYAGNCVLFDGIDDRVSVPPALGFPTSSVTVAAWVRISSHANWYDYVSNSWTSVPGSWLFYSSAPGEVIFGIIDGALSPITASGCAGSFTTDVWHFISGTYDGISVRVYLDGVQCGGAVALPNQTLYDAGSITIGESGSPGAATHFMDDVRVYNRALSSEEIAALFKSQPFSRKFFVENVCRTNDGAFAITATYPCVGLIEDPSTQKITAITEWFSGGKIYESRLSEYVTRWKNRVFHQTDWSGGEGVLGPLNYPGRAFSSSTNTEEEAAPGSVKIQGI